MREEVKQKLEDLGLEQCTIDWIMMHFDQAYKDGVAEGYFLHPVGDDL